MLIVCLLAVATLLFLLLRRSPPAQTATMSASELVAVGCAGIARDELNTFLATYAHVSGAPQVDTRGALFMPPQTQKHVPYGAAIVRISVHGLVSTDDSVAAQVELVDNGRVVLGRCRGNVALPESAVFVWDYATSTECRRGVRYHYRRVQADSVDNEFVAHLLYVHSLSDCESCCAGQRLVAHWPVDK